MKMGNRTQLVIELNFHKAVIRELTEIVGADALVAAISRARAQPSPPSTKD